MEFNLFCVVFYFFVGLLAQDCHCQDQTSLSLTLATARFPENISSASVIYDGNDTIYIFGGQGTNQNDKIHSYSISSDILTYESTVGAIEYGGSLIMDNNGDIFYFVRYSVFKFYPGTLHSVIQIASLDSDVTYSTGVKAHQNSSQVYFIGQTSSKIPCFDLSTLSNCPDREQTTFVAGSISVEFQGSAYVFLPPPFYLWPLPQRLTKIDLGSFEFRNGPVNFPFLYSKPGIAVRKDWIYLVGGHNETWSAFPTTGIIQLEPNSWKPTFFPVQNFMIDNTQLLINTRTEYVEKLDRLYIFGGLTRDKVYEYERMHRNEIWYIDFTPLRT